MMSQPEKQAIAIHTEKHIYTDYPKNIEIFTSVFLEVLLFRCETGVLFPNPALLTSKFAIKWINYIDNVAT